MPSPKLAAPKLNEWYKYVEVAQQYLNTVPHKSTGASPFRVLFGAHPKLKSQPEIREILEKELIESFQADRNELRLKAKENLAKVQQENKKIFDKKRKIGESYRIAIW